MKDKLNRNLAKINEAKLDITKAITQTLESILIGNPIDSIDLLLKDAHNVIKTSHPYIQKILTIKPFSPASRELVRSEYIDIQVYTNANNVITKINVREYIVEELIGYFKSKYSNTPKKEEE